MSSVLASEVHLRYLKSKSLREHSPHAKSWENRYSTIRSLSLVHKLGVADFERSCLPVEVLLFVRSVSHVEMRLTLGPVY